MNEPRIVLAVILITGFGLLFGIGGIIALTWHGSTPPETLNTLSATCVGGLVGLLAQTNTKPRPPEPPPCDDKETP